MTNVGGIEGIDIDVAETPSTISVMTSLSNNTLACTDPAPLPSCDALAPRPKDAPQTPPPVVLSKERQARLLMAPNPYRPGSRALFARDLLA